MGVRVAGTGSYVPDAVVTNDHLTQRLGCDSDWIVRENTPHPADERHPYAFSFLTLERAGKT